MRNRVGFFVLFFSLSFESLTKKCSRERQEEAARVTSRSTKCGAHVTPRSFIIIILTWLEIRICAAWPDRHSSFVSPSTNKTKTFFFSRHRVVFRGKEEAALSLPSRWCAPSLSTSSSSTSSADSLARDTTCSSKANDVIFSLHAGR